MMEFDQIMREYMNYSDMETVHAIAEASDNNQNQMLVALTSKLYDKIMEKADKVDFSTISRSRGDITKIEKFDQLMECLSIIRNIVLAYKEDTHPVDVVSTAVENLRSRSDMFKRAFVIGSPVPIMTYNNIGLAIVYSVSFLISTCIEYIKEPGAESFTMALDTVAYNKTDSNLLFSNLGSFNESCKTGEFDKAMDVVINKSKVKRECAEIEIKQDAPFLTPEEIKDGVVVHDDDDSVEGVQTEGIVAGALGFALLHPGMTAAAIYYAPKVLIFLAKFLIPLLRNFVYFWFATQQKVADYWASQADLLEMNAYQLQYNATLDVDKKKKIMDKQLKVAAKWRNRANKWSVDYSVSKKKAEKLSADEAKKFDVKDLDYNPNEVEGNSVLF